MSNVRIQLIAAAVRILAEKDILVHKPDPFTNILDAFISTETYDVRIARDVDAQLDRAINTVTRINHKRRGIQNITTKK